MAIKYMTRRTTSPKRCFCVLLLTDVEPDLATIKAWTPNQRAIAVEWAMREHLLASDNDDVRRIKEPRHVGKLPRQRIV